MFMYVLAQHIEYDMMCSDEKVSFELKCKEKVPHEIELKEFLENKEEKHAINVVFYIYVRFFHSTTLFPFYDFSHARGPSPLSY